MREQHQQPQQQKAECHPNKKAKISCVGLKAMFSKGFRQMLG